MTATEHRCAGCGRTFNSARGLTAHCAQPFQAMACKHGRVAPASPTQAPEAEIAALAGTIAAQAEAIASGTLVGPRYAAVQRLKANVAMLEAWTGDDRS